MSTDEFIDGHIVAPTIISGCAVSLDHLVGAGEQWIALFRLEAGELDHLSPLLGFVGEKLTEVGG